jgi:hypothetical protein
MSKETESQRETVDRVMHAFKRGALKSSSGDPVKSPRQAIAIGLSEAGASDRQSPAETRKAKARSRAKAANGRTGMPDKEGEGARTLTELYAEAKRRNLPGRSKMDRDALARALRGG